MARGPRTLGSGGPTMEQHIRNPIEWGWQQLKGAGHAVGSATHAVQGAEDAHAVPAVRRITVADLGEVLAKGVADFGAYRTDVLFLCLIYPVAGVVIAYAAFGYDMVPMIFPLFAGFALLGPV